MIKNLILSIVSASDLLENGRLDAEERRMICFLFILLLILHTARKS